MCRAFLCGWGCLLTGVSSLFSPMHCPVMDPGAWPACAAVLPQLWVSAASGKAEMNPLGFNNELPLFLPSQSPECWLFK